MEDRLKSFAKILVMVAVLPLLVAAMVVQWAVIPALLAIVSAAGFLLWLAGIALWAVPIGLVQWAFTDRADTLELAGGTFCTAVGAVWTDFYADGASAFWEFLGDAWDNFCTKAREAFGPEPEASRHVKISPRRIPRKMPVQRSLAAS